MSSITRYERFDNNGLELVIDTQTGEAYSTVRGYARMSGLSQPAISQRISRSKGDNKITLKAAEIQTPGGLQGVELVPLDIAVQWMARDYHKLGDPNLFSILQDCCKRLKLSEQDTLKLFNYRRVNKNNQSIQTRERLIQLEYQSRLGGEIEYPVASGRIDLLTETAIYEFKIFREYKNCLGQLLSYDDCIPGLALHAVLFDVPKALSFDGSECQRIKALFAKYNILTEFLS